MNHIRKHQHHVKISEKKFDYGYPSHCGLMLQYASTSPLPGKENCRKCVKGFLLKEEARLVKLKVIWENYANGKD